MLAVLLDEHQLPVQRACRIVRLSRTAFYRPPPPRMRTDAPGIAALTTVVAAHGRWGFWKGFDRLRLEGRRGNHPRVHRVYCALRLHLPRRIKRRVPLRLRQPLLAPPVLNHTGALDSVTDALYSGQRFRALTILAEGNREGLALEVATSIPSPRGVRVLEDLVALHGRPRALRTDNGPEFIAQPLVEWCEAHAVARHDIQPGKPDQHAYIERFNRSYRTEVLDAYAFEAITQVRDLTETWLESSNRERPHDRLGRVPPLTFLPRRTSPGSLTSEC